MTFEEFRLSIYKELQNKPSWSRKGQFVFNYIDEVYGIAREIQFIDKVDCFYDDEQIDSFILKCYCKLKENNKI